MIRAISVPVRACGVPLLIGEITPKPVLYRPLLTPVVKTLGAVWKPVVPTSCPGVAAFVMFEIWFKIPLPKGPVERLLGF